MTRSWNGRPAVKPDATRHVSAQRRVKAKDAVREETERITSEHRQLKEDFLRRQAAREAPYRPECPNEHFLAGEKARREGVARDDYPHDYPGSRWEWEAGWDREDEMAAREAA